MIKQLCFYASFDDYHVGYQMMSDRSKDGLALGAIWCSEALRAV
jgi:hypothetical protein